MSSSTVEYVDLHGAKSKEGALAERRGSPYRAYVRNAGRHHPIVCSQINIISGILLSWRHKKKLLIP